MRRARGRACLVVLVVTSVAITGWGQAAATASTGERSAWPNPTSHEARPRATSTTPTFSVVPITGASACIRRVTGINSDGDVVGTGNFPYDINGTTFWLPEAFEWSLLGGVKRLPFSASTAPNASGSAAEGQDCSNIGYELTQIPAAAAFGPGGEILGGTPHWVPPNYEPSSNSPAAWASADATPTVLPNLCGQSTKSTGAIFASNAAGDLVGSSLYSSSCQSVPLEDSTSPFPFYTPSGGTPEAIPSAPGAGQTEFPTAINGARQVVVGYVNASTKLIDLGIWSPGTAVVPLGFRFGENQQFAAEDLSSSGVVVGENGGQAVYSLNKPGETSAGSVVTLPPSPGYLEADALGVNDAGDVVGFSAVGTAKGPVDVATAWPGAAPPSLGKGDSEPAPVNLNALIPQNLGLTLTTAVLINDDDDIVALADTSSGSEEWVELQPNCTSDSTEVRTGGDSNEALAGSSGGQCLRLSVTNETGSKTISMPSGIRWLGTHKNIAFTDDNITRVATINGEINFIDECLAGCVNILVKVYNGIWGTLVGGAHVTATVDKISIKYKHPGDNGHLCVASTFASGGTLGLSCGTTVSATSETASTGLGQVALRYWGTPVANNVGHPVADLTIEAQKTINGVVYGPTSKQVTVNLTASSAYTTGSPGLDITPTDAEILRSFALSGDISSTLSDYKSFIDQLRKTKVLDKYLPPKDLTDFFDKADGYVGSVADLVMVAWADNLLGVQQDGLVFENLHKILGQLSSYLLDYVDNKYVKKVLNWIKDKVLGPSADYAEGLVDALKAVGRTIISDDYNHQVLYLDMLEASYCSGSFSCLTGGFGGYSFGSRYALYVYLSDPSTAGGSKGTWFNVTTGYAAPTWLPEQCASNAVGDACRTS